MVETINWYKKNADEIYDHLDEYGRPAWRWRGDIEDRVAGTVHQVVNDIKNKKTK